MAGPNMDQFEAYFRSADLDGDGKITGAEAVAFFQASNLSKPVLAQIWMHADQNKSGFLGRNEFYNALRLVTVAQSKRELTPDIVKAALFGPAAAKIPAPHINLAAVAVPQPSAVPTAPMQQQMGSIAPTPSQNFGFRGPAVPNAGINQNYFPQQNQSIRPPQSMPNSTTSLLPQGIANQSIRPLQHMPSSTSFLPPQGIANQSIRPPQSMPSSTFSLLPQGIANQSIRPPQSMPRSTFPHLPQGISGGVAAANTPNSTISNDWLSGGTGAPSSGPRGMSPSMPTTAPKPQASFSELHQPTVTDSKTLVVSGNGFASTSSFGDIFSAAPSASREEPSRSTFSATSTPPLLATVPSSIGPQTPSKFSSLDSLQSAFSMQPAGSQFQRPQSPLNPSQPVLAPGSSSLTFSGVSAGVGSSASDSPQPAWPKMKQSDIQKYMKVFMEVDTDRDGKITGEQARNLFLSWRLPREVLKQVWDLSDQDSDSMLSLREFCFALYLMERYREGRPLPPALPNNVVYDETLLSMTDQPKVTHGNEAWGPSPGIGFGQQQVMQGAQPVAPSTGGFRPPVQASVPKADGVLQSNQQKSSAPILDDFFLNQKDNGRQKSEISKSQEPLAAEEKVEKTEKVILDSKEKMEFYRSKMQELVLYKSRCDNKLNEITERAHADKHEAESLAKKYEEKYKQVAEIASKLMVEEATFRDIQARKMEYQQAIVKMEQGGSADGILQVRADRIQYDIEELVKALAERCRKHGINIKSIAVIELPRGWAPGIQDGAAVWDEEWDKFEDEGFGNDLSIDSKNASVPPGPHSVSVQNGIASSDFNSTVTDENAFENESAFIHSEDEYVRSPHGSPAGRTPLESPSQEFPDRHYGKDSEVDTETHRSFDESTWGAFDNNDDVDSVWGFNTSKSKDPDSEKRQDFFGSDDFGVRPVKTGSPQAGTTFQKRPFSFDESVPATPLSRFGNSPRYSEAGDFDNFSRFDSFSMHDSGLSPLPDRLSRFDSINSSKDFGQNTFSRFDYVNSSRDFGQNTFSRFDSMSSTRDSGNPTLSRIDSMSSTRDFGNPAFSRIDSMSSNRDFGQSHEMLTRFDSINSTKDFGQSGAFSFDDSDPFGSSAPFKVLSENQPPKKGSDKWSAF